MKELFGLKKKTIGVLVIQIADRASGVVLCSESPFLYQQSQVVAEEAGSQV